MEFSQLNGYKVKDKKAIRFYDSVASMKADTTLKDGMHVKTKGYYSANDGGHGEYIIKSTSTGLYETLNNELVGELVINGEININSLGADSTGINDSSSIFNSAFQYINTLWLSGNYKINTILTNGKYLWNNQVIMPPCAKLKGNGFTTILTNVNGSALKIDYLSTDIPSVLDGNKQDWLQGEMINFSQGGLFKNIGTDLTNTCIEIGRDSDIGALLPFSRYKLCNFRIYNYNIGILHNKYHNYVGKFDNISFETNKIGVQYGIDTGVVTDSGENMTYNNCLFSSNSTIGGTAVKWLTDGFDSSFINCSFDYLLNIFDDNTNKGYKRIVVSNSHLEGFTYICSKLGEYSILTINNSSFVYQQHGDMFANIHDNSYISLENNKILPTKTNIFNPENLIEKTKNIYLFNNFIGHNKMSYPCINRNLMPSFDSLEDGSVTLAENQTIGGYTITGLTGSVFTGEIVTDDYLYTGHKSLVLTGTSEVTTKKNIILQSDYLPISALQKMLYGNLFTYNCCGSYQIKYSFYDLKKSLISETSGYIYIPENSNKTKNQWYGTCFGKSESIPSESAYVKITFGVLNVNNEIADEIGTEYKIGGFIVN